MSIRQIIQMALSAAVVVVVAALGSGRCEPAPEPLDPPTRKTVVFPSRAEVWQTLFALNRDATLIVIAEPTTPITVPANGRRIIDMKILKTLKGDINASESIKVMDGVGVDKAPDYPSGQLLDADTNFLLFLREFEYRQGGPTGEWINLGPEGVYIDLARSFVVDADTDFTGMPPERHDDAEPLPLLSLARVCELVGEAGAKTGPGCPG